MPRTIAALIRHGDYQQLPHTPSALQPFPLTPTGCQQAESAAATINSMLSRHHWSPAATIDSSQLLRAWQTADTISRHLHRACPAVECFDALAERSMGSAANLSIAQIESILEQDPRYSPPPPNWKARSDYQLPLQGAESLNQAGQRVASHLDARMRTLHAEATTDTLKLFVGHGASFRHAAWQLGVLRFEQIAQLSMHHGSPVLLEYREGGCWAHIGGDWKQRKPAEEVTD